MQKIFILIILAIFAGGSFYFWKQNQTADIFFKNYPNGNGRLEATEIAISSKLGGIIDKILVNEGDLVEEGQPLVLMDTKSLNAQMEIAKAQKAQALAAESNAKALVEVRKSDIAMKKAMSLMKENIMIGAKKKYERTLALKAKDVVTPQQFDEDESNFNAKKADFEASTAEIKQAEAQLGMAMAELTGAKAQSNAADAEIQRIQTDLDFSVLKAPCKGRIQYRIAQKGEVIGAGGRVLNLLDLSEVYMTFFLPEFAAGQLAIGTEARIFLDCWPQNIPIPATISYVSSVAQFTPKTVETKSERQKMMFRIKAKVDQVLLMKYIDYVKTGLPGAAYVKLDPKSEWPKELQPTKSPKELQPTKSF